MNNLGSLSLRIITGLITIAAIASVIYFLVKAGNQGNDNFTKKRIDEKLAREESTYNQLQFNLVDANGAPEPIKNLANLGFNIMVHTKKYAIEYVGNDLNCTNCHFAAGNTTGGPQGGISLAGVATKYPNFDPTIGKVIDLPHRINNCFIRSMNGKPLPENSEMMLALLTYFQWISKNLPIYGDIPWLKLPLLSSKYHGNPIQGKKIFDKYCLNCHQEIYRGEVYPPPLWGDGSFNDGAGFAKVPKLASFIYWNMPYDDRTPVLSEEEAIDVATYIISKTRPHFFHSK
jgi:thiosulfate dehydrogenase